MADLRDPKDIMLGDITLAEAIEKHMLWLTDKSKGERLDASGADLQDIALGGAYLYRANLTKVNLYKADLSGANLSKALMYKVNLISANLSGANLSNVNLRYADLAKADLRGADLTGANLSYANLNKADLRGADLTGANLSYANLNKADLRGADLTGANLSYTNLSKANLRGAGLRETVLRGANLRESQMPKCIGPSGSVKIYFLIIGGSFLILPGIVTLIITLANAPRGFTRGEPFDYEPLCWAGILLLIGIPLLISGIRYLKIRITFENSSLVTEGKVIDRHSDADLNRYQVVVGFNAGEKQVTLRAKVSEGFYSKTKFGKTFKIRYATSNPRIALFESEKGFDSIVESDDSG